METAQAKPESDPAYLMRMPSSREAGFIVKFAKLKFGTDEKHLVWTAFNSREKYIEKAPGARKAIIAFAKGNDITLPDWF